VKALSWAVATAIGLTASVALPAVAAARPGCDTPIPGRVARLSNADNGRTVCAHRGQRIDVTLVVDPVDGTVPEQWWHPVELGGTGLTALPMTLMAVQGTTLARYRATGRGRGTLSAFRRVCAPPPPDGAACDAMESWSVTVVIR
jgi:hypothetical protein